MIFILLGHMNVVKWLISHGAKLSVDKYEIKWQLKVRYVNKFLLNLFRYGKSPINDAAENQQTECLNLLVQHSDLAMSSSTSNKYNKTRGSEKHTLSNNFLLKCSSSNSDSEPFYLHPPTCNKGMRVSMIYFYHWFESCRMSSLH